MNLKKLLIQGTIGTLIISSIISIIIFLLGEFGEIQQKILATTFTLFATSLVSLISLVLKEKKKLISFSNIGLYLTPIIGLIGILMIWDLINSEVFTKGLLSFFILLGSGLIISLLTKKDNKKIINQIKQWTFASVLIVTFMLIWLVVFENTTEIYIRILGVFSVLAVLGIILIPVLRRI